MPILLWKKRYDKSTTDSEVYSICDDVLMYWESVVVPQSLQGYRGISKMKSLMKNNVYWRNMERGIESLVKSCKACALALKHHQ